MREPTTGSHPVFDAEAVTHADSTGLDALADVANDLSDDGITLVARMRAHMLEQLEQAGLTDTIGTERLFLP